MTTTTSTSGIKRLRRDVDHLSADITRILSGGSVNLYFDDADIIAALDGVGHLYLSSAAEKFGARALFMEPTTTVRNLAEMGYFGKIQVTSSHRAELTRQLVSRVRALESNVVGRLDPSHDQFIAQLERDHVEEKATQSVRQRDLRLEDAISHASEIAEQQFNIFSFRHRSSYARLLRIITEDNWLALATLSADDSAHAEFSANRYLSDPTFQLWLDAFTLQRPGSSLSNFVDAMAVAEFYHMKRGSRVVNRLYDSRSFYENASRRVDHKRAPESSPPVQQVVASLVGDTYFLLWAQLKLSDPNTDLQVAAREIEWIRKEVAHLDTFPAEFFRDTISSLASDARRAVSTLNRVRRLSFLERIWLPGSPISSEPLIHDVDGGPLSTDVLRSRISQFRVKLEHEVSDLVDELRDAAVLWSRLPTQCREIIDDLTWHPDDWELTERACVRYGIIKLGISYDTLRSTLDRMLAIASDNDSGSHTRLATEVIEIRQSVQGDKQLSCDLALMLWLTGHHKPLATASRNGSLCPTASTLGFDAESRMCNVQSREAEDISIRIARWIAAHEGPRRDEDDDIACHSATIVSLIQCGYLAYLAATLRGAAQRVDRAEYMDSLEHPRHWAWWKHARKAIEIADRLADIVHEIRRDMYRNQARGHETSSDRRLIHLGQQVVYAMNYHGFIHAELNMDATMDQLMLAAQELPQIRLQGYWRHIPSHIIWSYRYDDTLARIYLAMALLSKASGESTTRSPSAASISSPDDLIFDGTGALITWACKSALEASKRAMNGGGHRDTEVYDFHHYLRGVILKMLGSPPA